VKIFLELLHFFKSRYPESLEFFSPINPINLINQTDPIAGLSFNSKNIKSGEVFIALAGHKLDGRNYIQQAIDNGASGILIEILEHENLEELIVKFKVNLNKIFLIIKNLKKYLSSLAFYCEGFENLENFKKPIFAVTGTNGKTTVSMLLAQFFNGFKSNKNNKDNKNYKCAVIGTLGAGFLNPEGDIKNLEDTQMTTPDALSLARLIKKLDSQGAEIFSMEASSHALDQHRLSALPISTAIFTNLTQDHLDYHENMANYAMAKSLLFKFESLKNAVLNLDDNYCPVMETACLENLNLKNKIIKFSLGYKEEHKKNADVCVLSFDQNQNGFKNLKIKTPLGILETDLFLMGLFNLSNYLAVIGALILEGFSLDEIKTQTPKLKTPLGRMEVHTRPGLATIIIDYAHTPDAIEKALISLRSHLGAHGKLWIVFGCGGDRDRTKRPKMAEVAECLADFIIVTEDNSRFESPAQIKSDIFAGFKNKQIKYIERRDQAIRFACEKSSPEDLILLAGKGHEKYLEQQGVRNYFDERDYIF